MSNFQWIRMVLVEFLVPIAWPLVALSAALILKSELRAVVQKLADSIGKVGERLRKGKVGPVEVELHDLPSPRVEVKQLPLPPSPK